jgi:hypothetical protein
MELENNIYLPYQISGDSTSYEEQLLENYDQDFNARLMASNHYNLKLGKIEDYIEDDFQSEYDENDWEEEDSEKPKEEFDIDEKDNGTFLM